MPRSGYSWSRYRRRRRLPIWKLPKGLPNHLKCRVKYCEKNSIDVATGLQAGILIYRASSCYDPCWTGVGGTPIAFQSLTKHYRWFIVLGSRITVEPIFATTAGVLTEIQLGLRLTDINSNSIVPTDPERYEELTGRRMRRILLTGNQSIDPRTLTLRSFYSLARDGVSGFEDAAMWFNTGQEVNAINSRYFTLYAYWPGEYNSVGSNPPPQWFAVTVEYILYCWNGENAYWDQINDEDPLPAEVDPHAVPAPTDLVGRQQFS